jgi:hypothetical protein
MMLKDDSLWGRVFSSITASDIATPLACQDDVDSESDITDPFCPQAALIADQIVDWSAFQVAKLNHIIRTAATRVDEEPPTESDFVKPYASVHSETPLVSLFGELIDDFVEVGDATLPVPPTPNEDQAAFWVVVDADGAPTGTLTPDNLLRLPGRMYLLSLTLRMERLAAEYCYHLPHLFWNLQEDRRRSLFAQSLNYDARWWRQVIPEHDRADGGLELIDESLQPLVFLAAQIQQRQARRVSAQDQEVVEGLSLLQNQTESTAGRRFALRLVMEQTTLRDRKNMLGRSQNLYRHRDLFYAAFDRANAIRDRIVHPYPAMSTDAKRFWDFEELEPMAHEPLDDGLDRPLYEPWPQLLNMKTLSQVRADIAAFRDVIALLKAAT